MNFKHIVTLSLVLLVGYLGYTIQTQKGAYVANFESITPTQNPVDTRTEIADFVKIYSDFFQNQFDSLHSVGGAMTIVYKGQVVCCKPYGVKKQGTHDSVNVHTRFRLASVSKGFAGVLASKMAEREAIDLDEPIITYLPSLHLSKTYNEENVTLRHVLSHTSGLLGYSFDSYVESGLSFHQIYQKLHVAKIDALPGQHYAYQNVMFSLLDTVLQLRTGMTYANLMKENLFLPLGMKDASVGFNGFVASKNFAYPHKMLSAKTLTYKVCDLNERYYATAPAAGVNASISDLSIWLRAIMGYAPQVVSPNVLNEIGTSYVSIPMKGTTSYWGPKLEDKGYGLGWRVFTYNGEKILYHGGYVQGYRSEIIVWPEKEIAMAMLLNSPNLLAKKAVPFFVNLYSFYLNPSVVSLETKEESTN
ncbi:MAG: beta-lactamase family protein [Bacteroidales bacterium]|nr:beta-lactamase family protein [Bacteroidales bacterium]